MWSDSVSLVFLIWAESPRRKNNHQCFEINGVKFTSKLLGKFNVSNIISCVCYLKYIGFELRKIAELVAVIDPVPGRFNSYNIKGRTFIIDYAHTPDGLENVLKLCQSIKRKDKKLVCVFGCGGNRETQKRKIMGEISSKLADFVIITSDNPRYEQRADIARDIEQGVASQNYKIILDRALAIRFAYEISNIEDIVLIAGKGEENYIDEQGEKLPYSDREEVLKLRNNND